MLLLIRTAFNSCLHRTIGISVKVLFLLYNHAFPHFIWEYQLAGLMSVLLPAPQKAKRVLQSSKLSSTRQCMLGFAKAQLAVWGRCSPGEATSQVCAQCGTPQQSWWGRSMIYPFSTLEMSRLFGQLEKSTKQELPEQNSRVVPCPQHIPPRHFKLAVLNN